MDLSDLSPLLDSKSVRILYVSDVHESILIPMVQPIFRQLIKRNDINLLFVGGDLGNDKHSGRNDITVNSAEVTNEEIYEDLFLSKLASFNIPIVFVPGNHDSVSLFHNKYVDGKKGILNIHNRVIEIAPDLYCIGVGGSCPAYDESKNLIWKGYPNEDTDLDCTESIEQVASIPENGYVIQFTHCPPSFAYTSHVVNKEKGLELDAGSDSLTKLYDTLSQSHPVPLYLHGHCHQVFGSNLMQRSSSATHVLSCGSLMKSFYAIIKLARINDKWIVKQQELRVLCDS